MWVCSLILFPVVVALCICIKNEFNTTKSDCKKSFITYTLLKTLIREWKDKSQTGRQYFNLIYLIHKLYLEYMESSKNWATNKLLFIVQSLSHILHFATPWTAAHQASMPFTISRNLFKFISIELVMPSNHLILCHPLLLLPSIFPSTGIPFNKLAFCIRWSKYLSFSVSAFSEYSGLISFKIDWFDRLAVWETLKNLFQHHNLKVSILWWSALFMVQLSHLYMITGKTIALTMWTFVSKVMSLLFNILSRFVIAFLSMSKHLLISWLHSLFTLISEPKKIKSVTVSTFPPIYLLWNYETKYHDLSFLKLNFKPAFITVFFHPHQEAL